MYEDTTAAVDKILRDIERVSAQVDGTIARKNANKAAAILAGAYRQDDDDHGALKAYTGEPFLRALSEARRGNYDSHQALKGVLGTSTASGLAILPNNFVAGIVEFAGAENVYRQVMNFQGGFLGAGVDIPYDIDDIEAALLQGAYGSNKDVRDHHFGDRPRRSTRSRRSWTSATSCCASPTAPQRLTPGDVSANTSPRPKRGSSPGARARPSRSASSRRLRTRS